MYRISPYVVRNAAVLMRRINPVELRIATLSQTPVSQAWYKKIRERDPCPPKPPPPLPPYRLNFYLCATGVFLALTAGFVVFARNNPEVRDWLSINAPWFDNFIAMVNEENMPIFEGIGEYITYYKELIAKYLEELPEECNFITTPPVPVADKPAVSPSDDKEDAESCKDEEEEDVEEEEEEEDECVIPEEPIITKDICKLEECLKETAEEVVNNYMTARDYCHYYNKLVQGTLLKFSMPALKHLKSQMEERDEVKEKYIDDMTPPAEKRFEDLVHHFKCFTEGPKDRLEVTAQKIVDYKDIIKRNKMEYEIEYERSLTSDKKWKMVECLIDKYVFEVGAMYPELDLYSDHPNIEGEFDLLLIHTKKFAEMLHEDMYEALYSSSSKINRAYNAIPVPKGKEKEHKDKLQAAVKKAKADMDKEFQGRVEQIKKDNDDDLKAKLAKQKEVCDRALERRLEMRKAVAQEKADKMVDEKVAAVRKQLTTELEKMKLQLNLVEDKLNARLKAEAETRRASLLHVASSNLLAATRKGDPRVKVDKELEILQAASADDQLVTTVLNAIPGEVKAKGLVPECVIRQGYYSMEDVAMKVSMVESQGAPLPLYAFSWLQSKFLFMKPTTIPQAELDNPPKEPFKDFDTFDLLQRARYFMSKGNLASAVRYVDALEGASRGAAEAWYQSANALLQTRQAAEAIIAHAAAITLKYL